MEVVGEDERTHNAGQEIGVRETFMCFLSAIPVTINYKGKSFTLRGAVGFTPPEQDSSIGHYRGYSIRTDLTWEIYDDLRDKVIVVDGSVEIRPHIIIYTI